MTKPRTADLARAIGAMARAARGRLGASDVLRLRCMKMTTRIAEALGRVALLALPGPAGFGVGVAALTYYFAVEAQLNHSILHGAYASLPGAGRFTPRRYETLAVPFQCRTWRDAHRIHHANPSLFEKDPDTVHPLFRVHGAMPRRAWHFCNAFIGWFLTFEHWAFDYDAFLKRTGHRALTDRAERWKIARYVGYHFVLFAVIAGVRWSEMLVATLFAIVLRNIIFTALQTASSVGQRVSTVHAMHVEKKRGSAWIRFQVETSKNFIVGPLARILVGGLDRHIEHHLFPRLPPNRLHALSDEVRALCEIHGVRYEEHASIAGSLRDSITHLHKLAR